MEENVNIIQTDTDAKDGRNKCPKCGSTDISQNLNSTKLRCNFCRHEFEAGSVTDADIFSLEGMNIGSGAKDIIADTQDVVTLKCDGCGAEVVIDTGSTTQARCHWCRSTLSINTQIPNGAVPDALLPFSISKEDAEAQISSFVKKRKFFAHPTFTKEFNAGNIFGVYLPYMVIDINAHMEMSGEAEILVREYEGKGDDDKTYYDADAYRITRRFDIGVDDLTVEASADKLKVNSSEKTTNIINSIMPFDTENRVKYNANYLKGFTSEKRDTNIQQIKEVAHKQAADVARLSVKKTISKYNRGVCWNNTDFSIRGEAWKSMYLPIWLYSYMQRGKNGNNKLHYVAVNGRTKETMGSVPINMTKLWAVSILMEIFALLLVFFLGSDFLNLDSELRNARWALLFGGPGFFALQYTRYRNSDKRHIHELETKYELRNMQETDHFMEHRYGLSDSTIRGENSREVSGALRSNFIDFS